MATQTAFFLRFSSSNIDYARKMKNGSLQTTQWSSQNSTLCLAPLDVRGYLDQLREEELREIG